MLAAAAASPSAAAVGRAPAAAPAAARTAAPAAPAKETGKQRAAPLLLADEQALRAALLSVVEGGGSLMPLLREAKIESVKSTAYRLLKEVRALPGEGEEWRCAARARLAQPLARPARRGSFPLTAEDLYAVERCIRLFALRGFPLTEPRVHALLQEAVDLRVGAGEYTVKLKCAK